MDRVQLSKMTELMLFCLKSFSAVLVHLNYEYLRTLKVKRKPP